MKELKLSEIIKDLQNGITRKEFMSKYELTVSDVKKLLSHRLLKDFSFSRSRSNFVLVDDLDEQDREEVMQEEVKKDYEIESIFPSNNYYPDRYEIKTEHTISGNISNN